MVEELYFMYLGAKRGENEYYEKYKKIIIGRDENCIQWRSSMKIKSLTPEEQVKELFK